MNQRVDTTTEPATRSRKIPQTAKADAAPKTTAKTRKTTSKQTPAPTTNASTGAISSDERLRLIAEAAYYLAEKRGFSAGNELEDWVMAEREVNARYPG